MMRLLATPAALVALATTAAAESDRERAERMISEAMQSEFGALLDFSGMSDLDALPHAIADLDTLVFLQIGGSGVTDLTPLAGAEQLHTLMMQDTAITDIAPVAHLPALQTAQLAGQRSRHRSPAHRKMHRFAHSDPDRATHWMELCPDRQSGG